MVRDDPINPAVEQTGHFVLFVSRVGVDAEASGMGVRDEGPVD